MLVIVLFMVTSCSLLSWRDLRAIIASQKNIHVSKVLEYILDPNFVAYNFDFNHKLLHEFEFESLPVEKNLQLLKIFINARLIESKYLIVEHLFNNHKEELIDFIKAESFGYEICVFDDTKYKDISKRISSELFHKIGIDFYKIYYEFNIEDYTESELNKVAEIIITKNFIVLMFQIFKSVKRDKFLQVFYFNLLKIHPEEKLVDMFCDYEFFINLTENDPIIENFVQKIINKCAHDHFFTFNSEFRRISTSQFNILIDSFEDTDEFRYFIYRSISIWSKCQFSDIFNEKVIVKRGLINDENFTHFFYSHLESITIESIKYSNFVDLLTYTSNTILIAFAEFDWSIVPIENIKFLTLHLNLISHISLTSIADSAMMSMIKAKSYDELIGELLGKILNSEFLKYDLEVFAFDNIFQNSVILDYELFITYLLKITLSSSNLTLLKKIVNSYYAKIKIENVSWEINVINLMRESIIKLKNKDPIVFEEISLIFNRLISHIKLDGEN